MTLHYLVPEESHGEGALWWWEDTVQEEILKRYHPCSWYWHKAGWVTAGDAMRFMGGPPFGERL